MSQSVKPTAPAEEESKLTALERLAVDFQERPNVYFRWGFLALVVVIVGLIVTNIDFGSGKDHFSPVWEVYREARNKIASNQAAPDELAALDAALATARGTDAEGTALWFVAMANYGSAFTSEKITYEDRKPCLDKAEGALQELEGKDFDYFPPSQERFFVAGSGGAPVASMLAHIQSDRKWAETNSFAQPTPDEAPTAVVRTTDGDVYLRFFRGLAPAHVDNFIALAKTGTYNGTAFFFRNGIDEATSVIAGDPLTYFYNDPLRKLHILRWGKGSLGFEVPPGDSRFRIVHRRGVVSAARRPSTDWDLAAQFHVVTDTEPSFDRQYSPFAQVVEGMDVVDKIAARKTAENHAPFKDQPEFKSLETQGLFVEPAWIEKVIVFDAQGNAMEHRFPLDESEKKLSTLKSA
ncbi:MAG: peptidylprolyl isomerase, partial [Planctomycetota bacterium]